MSFFRALFDFSFSEFVTTKIIKILYVISIILAALGWLFFLITSLASAGGYFGTGVWGVLGGLIGAPIGFVLTVIFSRVGYEILIVLFGIAEHTRDMAWALTGGRKAPGGPALPQQQGPYPPQPQPYNPPQPPPQQPRPQAYPQYPQQPTQQPPQYPQYPQQPQQPPQPPQYPPKS